MLHNLTEKLTTFSPILNYIIYLEWDSCIDFVTFLNETSLLSHKEIKFHYKKALKEKIKFLDLL